VISSHSSIVKVKESDRLCVCMGVAKKVILLMHHAAVH
jgi:hypothetical protein